MASQEGGNDIYAQMCSNRMLTTTTINYSYHVVAQVVTLSDQLLYYIANGPCPTIVSDHSVLVK